MTTYAISVHFDESTMYVVLQNGVTLEVPLRRFPRLLRATPEQRARVEIEKIGLHWPDLDEDISIAGLLAGRGDQTRLGWGLAERP